MTDPGYSGKPLREKLGLKETHRARFVGVPASVLERLAPLPGPSDHPFDFVMWFPAEAAELEAGFAEFEAVLAGKGMLWVAWPKKSSPQRNTLEFANVQRAGLEAGLVDTKVCAVDEDFTGLKFLRRKDDPKRQSSV